MEALSGRPDGVQVHVVPFAAMPTDRPVNVLIVEDDQAVIDMLRRHLSRAGMTVQTASTEQDALRRASATLPDVIILDLGLAGGSGAGFCERVRAAPSIGDVPILVLSARDDLATKVGMLARRRRCVHRPAHQCVGAPDHDGVQALGHEEHALLGGRRRPRGERPRTVHEQPGRQP